MYYTPEEEKFKEDTKKGWGPARFMNRFHYGTPPIFLDDWIKDGIEGIPSMEYDVIVPGFPDRNLPQLIIPSAQDEKTIIQVRAMNNKNLEDEIQEVYTQMSNYCVLHGKMVDYIRNKPFIYRHDGPDFEMMVYHTAMEIAKERCIYEAHYFINLFYYYCDRRFDEVGKIEEITKEIISYQKLYNEPLLFIPPIEVGDINKKSNIELIKCIGTCINSMKILWLRCNQAHYHITQPDVYIYPKLIKKMYTVIARCRSEMNKIIKYVLLIIKHLTLEYRVEYRKFAVERYRLDKDASKWL